MIIERRYTLDLINHHAEVEYLFNYSDQDFSAIIQTNFVLGRDFGKGSCIMIMPLVVRFEDNRESEALDLECGQINHA